MYAVKHGLGMLPLAASQYLAAGAALLFWLGLVLLVDLVTTWTGDRLWFAGHPDGRRIRLVRLVFDSLSKPLAILAVGIFMIITLPAIPFLDITKIDLWVTFTIMAIAVGLTHGFGWLWIRNVWRGERRTSQSTLDAPPGKALLGPMPIRQHLWGTIVIGILLFAIFSGALLPAMNTEFGGAQPREATLDMELADLSTETIARLWPAWNRTAVADSVVRTPPVNILFTNADVLLVRPYQEDVATSPLFEIPRTSVRAIIWIS